MDSSSNVYVVDGRNRRVQKFTSSGTYLAQWGSSDGGHGQFVYPYGIAVDSSNFYVSDQGDSDVEKFDSSSNYLTQWAVVSDQFFALAGVAGGQQQHCLCC